MSFNRSRFLRSASEFHPEKNISNFFSVFPAFSSAFWRFSLSFQIFVTWRLGSRFKHAKNIFLTYWRHIFTECTQIIPSGLPRCFKLWQTFVLWLILGEVLIWDGLKKLTFSFQHSYMRCGITIHEGHLVVQCYHLVLILQISIFFFSWKVV